MKTTNWQTKALTLFIAAVALWLTVACDSADPAIEAQPAPATTATPTQVATQSPAVATPTPQVGCTHETPEFTSKLTISEEELERKIHYFWLASDALEQYEDLLWRQPNVYDVRIGQLRDNQGKWTERWGITVWVTEKLDQSSLPLEDRIPVSLDNVPIRITDTKPPPKVPESNCDYSKCVVNLEKGEESLTNPDSNTRIDPAELARRQGPSEYRVRKKYEPLFWSQPNAHSTGLGVFRDENGETTGDWGIVVWVTRKVDQSTLPPEYRIPDCLEGIPVQIKERGPWTGITI